MKFALTAGVMGLVGLATTAQAQDLTHKAPPQSQPILVTGGTVHTVSGEVIDDGAVLFEGGVFTVVTTPEALGLDVPRNTRVVDATGKHVYPGFVAGNTILGLMEIGAVDVTMDQTETGWFTPEALAAVAVNPDSTLIPVTRSNGILTAATLPVGGTFPGRASVIRLDGWTWEDMAVLPDAGLMVNWPSMRVITASWMRSSPSEQRERTQEQLDRIDESFDNAIAYLAAREADDTIPADLRYDAMAGAISGESPVLIRATELEQIQSAVTWAARRGMRCVIIGGDDAPMCAELLKKHDVGVIVTGTHKLPGRRDADYDESFTLPARLEEAGVRWCLASVGGSFETPHERNLPYHAATAVAYGLDADAALRSITLSAAEILGLGATHGSIEAGKAATFFIADGDALEITTQIERAWIDGREIDLSNKQTELDKKYREKYRQIDSNN